jgi:phospholipid transport system substrate-binding protein
MSTLRWPPVRPSAALTLLLGAAAMSPLTATAAAESPPQTGAPAVAADPAAAAEAAAGHEAVATIESLHEAFMGVLRDSASLDYEARRERLAPAIGAAYDSAFMARAAVGRQWDDLSAEEQKLWGESFAALTVANYAARLTRDSGKRFEVLGREDGSNGTVMLRTRVVDPMAEEEAVALDYRMRRTPQGWKIIDVFAKGTVSELALRRAEYSSLLRTSGFRALLDSINAKTAKLASGEAVD